MVSHFVERSWLLFALLIQKRTLIKKVRHALHSQAKHNGFPSLLGPESGTRCLSVLIVIGGKRAWTKGLFK